MHISKRIFQDIIVIKLLVNSRSNTPAPIYLYSSLRLKTLRTYHQHSSKTLKIYRVGRAHLERENFQLINTAISKSSFFFYLNASMISYDQYIRNPKDFTHMSLTGLGYSYPLLKFAYVLLQLLLYLVIPTILSNNTLFSYKMHFFLFIAPVHSNHELFGNVRLSTVSLFTSLRA